MSTVDHAAPNTMLELSNVANGGPDWQHDSVSLEQIEIESPHAVKQGVLEQVKLVLNEDSPAINIEKADLNNALIQSVFDNDLESVQILLKKKPDQDTNMQSDSYITPIILAVQMGHHEIVHLLLKNNQVIKKPPCLRSCGCDQCKIQCKIQSEMLRSQIGINSFRGLSNPDYMCLKYLMKQNGQKNPLMQAFDLNKELEQRANDEQELRKEYLKLSDSCRRFSVDLYNVCRSMNEITALFDIDEQNFSLNPVNEESLANVMATLRSAMDSGHKEFIAHPITQQLLNAFVYSDLQKWLTRSFFYKSFMYTMYTIFFPILVVIYIAWPQHKISRLLKTPFVKFLSHTTQFILFLALLAASALRNNHVPSILEYLIFICVLGMIVQETCEMLRSSPRQSYFFKWWNIITTIMLTLFAVAAVFWIIGFAITGGWSVFDFLKLDIKPKTGHHFLLLGNSFFSLAIVVSVFHFIDLCQVNSVLGPLQLSLYRMLQDVFKFLFIFFAMFMAFVMGVRNLYSYYNSVQEDIRSYYRKQNATEIRSDTNHPLSTFSKSTLSMFWALFDKVDLDDFNTSDNTFTITQNTGKILFAFYSICAVMVGLNMLIAMMTHSYESISKDEDDIRWKVSRTRLWMEFIEKGSTLPSPYNLIPNLIEIYHVVKRKFLQNRPVGQYHRTAEEDKNRREIEEKKRRTIINHLVERYLRSRGCQRKTELGALEDAENCKSEIIPERVPREKEDAKCNISAPVQRNGQPLSI